jgi:hypothetical protein
VSVGNPSLTPISHHHHANAALEGPSARAMARRRAAEPRMSEVGAARRPLWDICLRSHINHVISSDDCGHTRSHVVVHAR